MSPSAPWCCRCPGPYAPSEFSIYFTTLDLVGRLGTPEVTGRFHRHLAAHPRPGVLMVDEVGYLPPDRAEANMVFQLASRRYDAAR